MQVYHSSPHHQQGAALITGLLIMTVMTLVGIASMQSSITQTNLATNAQLKTISYQSAEAALTHATSFNYLSKSLDNLQTGTNLTLTQTASLDAAGKGLVNVITNGQVIFCGALPPSLVDGLSLDADQSITTTTYTRYVFDLSTTTDVSTGGRVQASTQHSQRSSRLMLSQAGGMPLCNDIL